MLIEEPTRGVDVGARAEIYQRLRDLCRGGIGIVAGELRHGRDPRPLRHVATFYRGRMTSMRPYAEWTEDELIREVMHQEAARAGRSRR